MHITHIGVMLDKASCLCLSPACSKNLLTKVVKGECAVNELCAQIRHALEKRFTAATVIVKLGEAGEEALANNSSWLTITAEGNNEIIKENLIEIASIEINNIILAEWAKDNWWEVCPLK